LASFSSTDFVIIGMITRLYLYRQYFPEATIGRLVQEGKFATICETLERPNLNNQRDNLSTKQNESSCIPEGDYLVEWTYSNALKKEAFILRNVPKRDGIRIHSANTADQLKGCIATASFVVRNVNNNPFWASGSKVALSKLENLILKELGLESFTLCIRPDSTPKDNVCKVQIPVDKIEIAKRI